MAERLWRCVTSMSKCSTLFFRGETGVCPRCGMQAELAVWPIKPARGDPVRR